MPDRGILYIVWGKDDKTERALERSKQSVKDIHPELPVEVCRLDVDDPIKGLLQKARMFELSPFNETLFLDADTLVLGRLDFGFTKAQEFGVACCICECPWANRYAGVQGETVEYGTGVLFFARRAKPVFDAWSQLAPKIDSSVVFHGPQGQIMRMPYADQGSFAVAIEETKVSPFVLPLNWNFRPQWQLSFFGPLKIWHDYSEPPAQFIDEMRKYYSQPDAIIQYHAAMR